MNIFTKDERTVKRHDVNFIFGQVRAVLSDKGIQGVNVNRAPDHDGQLYTTQEASTIIDRMVIDSIFGY